MSETMTESTYRIQGATGDWEVVIGMEVHAQVASQSKLFSGSSTAFGAEPNSHVSLVDAAMPCMILRAADVGATAYETPAELDAKRDQLVQAKRDKEAELQDKVERVSQFRGMARDYDSINGGFGSAPKFPQPMTLSFLMRYHRRTGN